MTELMVSLAIFALLLTGSLSVFIMGLRIWQTSTMDIASMQEASVGLEQMLYGSNGRPGLRQASTNPVYTVVTNTSAGWNIRFCVTNSTNSFGYSKSSSVITNQKGLVFCTNVKTSSITMSKTDQVIVYIQVTNSHGSITRTNDLTTSVFFRN